MRKLAILFVFLFVSPVTQAERQYWAISPGYADLADTGLGTLTALYGIELIPHISIEGRIGSTLLREEEEIGGETHKFGVDFFGSAFVRLNLLSEDIRPYILAGGTYGKASLSGTFYSGSSEESDFSWGGGISLHVREHGFHLEYIRYWNKNDTEFFGVNLGYIRHF